MTLRARFALWVGSLMLVALAAFGTFVFISVTSQLAGSLDDGLKLSASQLIATSDIDHGKLDISDPVILDGELTDELRSRGMSIQIFNTSGALMQAFGALSDLPLQPSSLAIQTQGQPNLTTLTRADGTGRVRVHTEPVNVSGRVIALVQVSQSLDGTEALQRSLLTTMLIGLPVVASAAAGGGYLLARRALAPIDHITRTARRISAEGLSERLELPRSNDELGRLAVTFDEMLTRLDAAFKRERQFSNDAAHELRTPLAAMQSILTVIAERRRTLEEYETALSDLAEETDKLRTLAEDLLQLGRVEAFMDVKEAVNITHMLLDVSETMRPAAEAKSLTLDCQVDQGMLLLGNTDALIRLFLNLVDNAIKYTGRGTITIRGYAEAGEVRVTVTDTGEGITASHLPRIFDRFYRSEDARTTPGTGIGLAICAEIAHSHGGTITVASDPGKGSTFTVTLPSAPAPTGGSRREPAAAAEGEAVRQESGPGGI